MAPQQFTATDPNIQARQFSEQQRDEENRKRCLEKGGTWDASTKTCTLPQEDKLINQRTAQTTKLTGVGRELLPEETQPTGPTGEFRRQEVQEEGQFREGDIITDQETGEPKGIIKDGKFFFLPREEIENIVRKRREREAPIEGAVSVAQRFEQQKLFDLSQSLGQLTPEQLARIQSQVGADIDIKQALGAGLIAAGPGFATGAVIGGFTTGGLAAIPLGLVVASGAFVAASLSNVRGQTSGEFSADKQALAKGERVLRALISDTNRNPQNAIENQALFNEVLTSIDMAHQKTWLDSQENLNRFLGKDGTPELAKFEVFNNVMKDQLVREMTAAIQTPNPNVNFISINDMASEI